MQQPQPYSNLYHNGIEYLVLLNGSQCTVIFSLLPLMEWNTNIVLLPMPVRDEICKRVNMKRTSFNVLLSNLTRNNFLSRVKDNVYRINPLLFWYGSEEAREDVIGRDWNINKNIKRIHDKTK